MQALVAGSLALAVSLAGCGAQGTDAASQPAADETPVVVAEDAAADATADDKTAEITGAADEAAEADPAEDDMTVEAPTQEPVELADGTYEIEVETDSSMFRSERCELVVEGGAYTASLSLPGEGFSRLYFGTAEEAATASDDLVYDYYLSEDGLYTFDVPVKALDEELQIAAFGHRRDTWYDHTITFHAPV